ncbi:VWA domain-containing protein [uncultured Algibacter sp.]|uniref:VWA domain-containing protein n=1 Tax=uncultured Algibacter sp. TaxID=298659 RepID=UPI002629591D|nr:VWA domain-containing protein [uncultured Algibacter sp.]
MSSETLLYIIFAGILALFIALFQYKYKAKNKSRFILIATLLRFITIFSILLLFINPKFKSQQIVTEKPNLILAIDNSSSIKHLNYDNKVRSFVEFLKSNQSIKEKFNLETYAFGSDITLSDSIGFTENQTNINQVFNQLHQIYTETISPTVIITDGNQTYGSDYEFITKEFEQPIYPIIVGDTIRYTDLKITQLNVNKYAYLKNSFPVETILTYNGNKSIDTRFVVTSGTKTVYSETVRFTKENNSKVINFTIPSTRVGVNSYKAQVVPLKNEKNIVNNSKNFAVEVIDQKTNIAIVSDFSHPDLGALKKSIESNEQRTVKFLRSNEITNQINDFQLIVVYQPNNRFKNLVDKLKSENKNSFIIVGPKADLNFVNNNYENFNHEVTYQVEDYQANLNVNYAPFYIGDMSFEDFPPLKSNYGSISFSLPTQTILFKSLNSIKLEEPLLSTYETGGRREAILFGENIWQWRAQSFINNQSFNEFDNFIGKLVQYLASKKRRSRLDVDYESFYNSSSSIIIKGQFFDKNYVFDARQNLKMVVTDLNSNEKKTFPFILKNSNYQVDLSSLPASNYSFAVSVASENISKVGNFEILEYNVEQQFMNANVTKLQHLATNSSGTSHFINNAERIIDELLNDNRFIPIQKSVKKTIPLIDWKYLLAIIAISLGLEWFLRKYNGLI